MSSNLPPLLPPTCGQRPTLNCLDGIMIIFLPLSNTRLRLSPSLSHTYSHTYELKHLSTRKHAFLAKLINSHTSLKKIDDFSVRGARDNGTYAPNDDHANNKTLRLKKNLLLGWSSLCYKFLYPYCSPNFCTIGAYTMFPIMKYYYYYFPNRLYIFLNNNLNLDEARFEPLHCRYAVDRATTTNEHGWTYF